MENNAPKLKKLRIIKDSKSQKNDIRGDAVLFNGIAKQINSLLEKDEVQLNQRSNYENNIEVSSILLFQNIICMLKKKPKERTTQEFTAFSTLIESSELLEKLKYDLTDDINMANLLYLCSLSMEDQVHEEGKVVYKDGENRGKIYLVVKGKMTGYKITEQVKEYTGIEYYHLLKQIHHNDHLLFEKTTKANSTVFNLRVEEDLEIIDEINFKVKYRDFISLKPSREEIAYFLISFSKNPSDFGLESIGGNLESMEALYSQQSYEIDTLSDYYFKYLSPSKEKVAIMSYVPMQSLTVGQYFSTENKEVALVKSEEHTLVLVLDLMMYNENLSNEKQKIKLKQVAFLHDSFFFNPIRKTIFEKIYYKEFTVAEYQRNSILFKENEEPRDIIFISEGIVELTINNRSIFDLQNISRSLQQLDQQIKIEDEELNLENSPKNYLTDLKEKRKYNMLKLGDKEILGEWEFFFGVKSIFTAKVVSDKARIYKLSYAKFAKMFEEDNILYRSLQEASILKVQSIVKRLNDVVNNFISRIDKNYSKIYSLNNQEKLHTENSLNVKINHHFLVNSEDLKSRIISTSIKIISPKINSINNSPKNKVARSFPNPKRIIFEQKPDYCTNEEIQIKNIKEQINSFKESQNYQLPQLQFIDSCSPSPRIGMLPKIGNKDSENKKNKNINIFPQQKFPYILPILNKMKRFLDKKYKSKRGKNNKSEDLFEQIIDDKKFLKPMENEVVMAVKEFYRNFNKNKIQLRKMRKSFEEY